jgi:predicted DsbA family dithiol-disulfide isomerase
MRTVTIRHFTDPGCPFAFSAEPRLRRLEWLYGDQLAWEHRMVVLSESPDDYAKRGFTPEKQSAALRKLAEQHGMPIDWSERERMPATVEACRPVVAARVHAGPEAAHALLRQFRVLGMGGGLLDDPALRRRAAEAAGIDAQALENWLDDDAVAEALAEDRSAARSPLPAARALDHKLGGPAEERRYTCPSLELWSDGAEPVAVPGFQPTESYEAALANLASDLERRPDPDSAAEVLDWGPFPLATAEVAAVCARDAADVRSELARGAARFEPVGADGYWSAP